MSSHQISGVMSNASALWEIVKQALRFPVSDIGQLLSSSPTIKIVEHSDRHLILSSEGRRVVIDKRFKTVKSGSKVLAHFDSVQSIDLRLDRCNDGPDTWTVSLYLGLLSRVHIGRSNDDTEASICAAHCSTVTGKKVLAL